MRADVGPDPLYKKPLETLTEEGTEPKVSEFIPRLGYRNLVDGEVVFFLE